MVNDQVVQIGLGRDRPLPVSLRHDATADSLAAATGTEPTAVAPGAPGVVRAAHPSVAASEHWLFAPGDGVFGSDALLVVVPAEPALTAGTPAGELLFEYRRPEPSGFDQGLFSPALVMHSIGLARNQPLPTQGEVRPTWFEAAIICEPGERWNDPQHDIGVEVLDGQAKSPGRGGIRIRIGRRQPLNYVCELDR